MGAQFDWQLSPSSGHLKTRRVPIFAWICAGFLVLVVFAFLWIGIRGALAAQHLLAASSAAERLVSEFQAEDTLDPELVDDLGESTSSAHGLTSDPIWGLASGLPWVGVQLAAVASAAESADITATVALPALAAPGALDIASLTPQNGRIDGSAIGELRQPLATASEALKNAVVALDGVQTDALIAPLADQIESFKNITTDAANGIDAAHRASVLAPDMLGASGPRTYLLLFQNNAEWRSLGGIPGQVAHLTVVDGRISLDAIVAASEFPKYEESVVPLADDAEGVYHGQPGKWMQDVTQIPDFAVGASLASEMWLRQFGETVDGVFAVDTVTLSYLLDATGPITLPTGDTITSENAVSLLLNEVYYRYPSPADQDAFFDAVAGTVFTSLTAGSPQPTPLLQALSRAGSERRILAWSADADEQQVIAGTAIAGELPASDAEEATFGVFLNDGTGSKMNYYLAAATSVDWTQCTDDLNVAALTVTISNASPPADELPDYITGGGAFGVPAGITRTVVYAYMPVGYKLVRSDLPDGVSTAGGYHDGRQVITLIFDQSAGDSTSFTLTAQGPAASRVSAQVTPTVNEIETNSRNTLCG